VIGRRAMISSGPRQIKSLAASEISGRPFAARGCHGINLRIAPCRDDAATQSNQDEQYRNCIQCASQLTMNLQAAYDLAVAQQKSGVRIDREVLPLDAA
jgi:hypothetical protein